jgi:iron complex transport system permease protein
MVAPIARPRSAIAVGGAAGIALVVACIGSLAAGASAIAPSDVVGALVDFDGSPSQRIVRNLRLARTLVGAVAGAALGAAGSLAQILTRNPLADPGLLGVSGGAALAVVISIAAFGVTSLAVSIWFALAGAAIASMVVFVMGIGGRVVMRPVRLALCGAAVTAFVGAWTSAIAMQRRDTLDQLRFWVVGSLSGRGWSVLQVVVPYVLVGLVLALGLTRRMAAMELGDDAARSLGTGVATTYIVTGLAITLLAGAATAACGPVLFVGLVAAHIARMLLGPDPRRTVPLAALLGALLVTACDALGRMVDRPTEIQVGIMAAIVGGPVFVLVVRRARLSGG